MSSAALPTDTKPLRPIPVISAPADPNILAAQVIAHLTRAPYFVRVTGYGIDGDRTKQMGQVLAAMPPLHPRKPFSKQSFTEVRIDLETASEESKGTRYSRTNLPLEAHTDSSFAEVPHELVAFHMIRPDPEGGESSIVLIDEVLGQLDAETLARLREPVYPFGKSLRPVLWQQGGSTCIRYYRTQLDADRLLYPPLSPLHLAAIDALDKVLADEANWWRFRLEAGDIVFLNNIRVLHGRSGFAQLSDRLMYRLRAFSGALGQV